MLRESANITALKSAFQRVYENHGCAGVDGVTVRNFESRLLQNLSQIKEELITKKYCPLPLLKILIDKGNGEARQLSIPTVRDRVVQTFISKIITPIFEAEFEDCSFAYRKGRSVKNAVHQIRKYYEDGYRWVVEADIDAFFDSVDHTILLDKVKRIIKNSDIIELINMWVKAEVWDGKSITTLSCGVPQGSVISPLLANLFLDEFDEELSATNCKLIRYSDDFIILCKNKQRAERALELSIDILDKLSLELDESAVVNFDHGFKFLGVIFVRSMAVVPFDKPAKKRGILYYPPTFPIETYLLKRKKGW